MAIFKKINPEFEKLPLRNLFVTSFVISAITLISGLFAQIILPPEIPLFYGLPQTSEQIAKSLYIALPSLISCIIIIINSFVSIKINDNFLKKTLAFTSLAVSLLAIITTYKIIFLVGAI